MNIILIIQSFIGSILGIIMVMGLSAIFKQHKMNFKIGMITVGVYWSIIGTYHLHLFSFQTLILLGKKIRKNVKSIVGISPTMVLLFPVLLWYWNR